MRCGKRGGNGTSNKGLPRNHTAKCGARYAMEWAKQRHDKQYHKEE